MSSKVVIMGGGYHGFASTGSFFITLHSIRTWPFMGMGRQVAKGVGSAPSSPIGYAGTCGSSKRAMVVYKASLSGAVGWRILADDGQFRFIVTGEPCAKVRRVF